MIPAGTPIEVLNYGSNRAYIKVDGKPMRLGHDYGRDQESLEIWVSKIVVNDDPRPRIATSPKKLVAAWVRSRGRLAAHWQRECPGSSA
jgi:hypothetical protein